MKLPSILDIHKAMKKNGMVVFTKPFSVTLGGIRCKDQKSNSFDDTIFASYWDDKGVLHSVVFYGTVDPGLSSRLNPTNKKGVAIIKANIQHRGVYEYQDPKTIKGDLGHKGKEAFRQIAPMKLVRDNTKDEILEFDGLEELSLSYTNGHDMGTLGKSVNNWSEGCWGSIEKNMDKLYAFAKIQLKNGVGRKFSFALLEESSL